MNGRASAMLTAALLAAGLSAGCSDSKSYAYVDVTVAIDRQSIPESTLALVASCEFEVRGVEMPPARNLLCPEGFTQYELGTFEWTTEADMGSLQFFVFIYNANRDVLGSGESPPVPLAADAHRTTMVTVRGPTSSP